ncbi:MAG TPA: molybdenum cofactor biosynthesis protein MoaE [Rhizomicrobium sp.]|nr:molybdenum cofactor biosynthesis protein MoaE [Rhizomicrobium sp.]
MLATIRISDTAFDPAAEMKLLPPDAGAVVSFVGRVREEHGLSSLRLEHYPGMTEREIRSHVDEAERRWALLGVTVVHRVGTLKPGEPIVLVLVAAAHRREAFAACEFLMDYLKTRAPFWKEESGGGKSRWVEAKTSDDSAAARWRR